MAKKKKHARWAQNRAGKTYGPNRSRYAFTCYWCVTPFSSARPDAVYCSNACKCAAARRRAALKRAALKRAARKKATGGPASAKVPAVPRHG